MEKEKKISIKAIVVGLITDIGGSLITGIIVGIIFGVIISASQVKQGVPPAELRNVDYEGILRANPVFYPLSVMVALGFTFLGGWVTGRIAKTKEILNATIMGLLSLVIGLLFLESMKADPLWYKLVAYGLTVPAAMVGGYVAANIRAKSESSAQESQNG